MLLLPHEVAISEFVMGLVLRHDGKVLPGWVWYRMLLWLPTCLSCIFLPIRLGIVVVLVGKWGLGRLGGLLLALGAFAILVPFLLWPPWWPLLRTACDVARRDKELRQQWRDQAGGDDDRDDDPDDH